MKLTSKLKEIRESLNLPLVLVAEKTGVGYHSMRYWEKGANANLHDAMKLAQFYGKSVEEIWSLKEEA